MVKVSAVLAQPLAVAITDRVAVIGAVVLFVGVKAGMFPVPVAGNPIAVLEFVQVYVVPLTPFVKTIGLVVVALQ